MSILKNNWHWILFALTIFGGIGVVLFTQLNTDTEPKTVYNLPSAETLQNIREKSAVQKAQETDGTKRLPPPGETHETGYWHDDHWHRTAPVETQDISTPVPVSVETHLPLLVELENPILKKPILLRTINVDGIDIDWASLSPDELSETIAKLERREITEPDGYRYRRRSDNSLLFDESGYPILHKIGEPFISVMWTMQFRPPPEVYEEYRQLARRRNLLDPSPELDSIRSQMEEMRRTYVGPLPVTFGISCAGNDIEAQKKRADETIAQLKAGFFRQLGIEYLLRRY